MIQGLNFTTTVAYLAVLREVDPDRRFLTPSCGGGLDSARKMLTEDRELFGVIAESNPFSQGSGAPLPHVSLPGGGGRSRSAGRPGRLVVAWTMEAGRE